MGSYRISELARRTGVPASTLRFYDTAGLLPAGRSSCGYRVYDDGAAERLRLIGAAKRLGLPLAAITELLAVWQSGNCTEVRAWLRPLVAGRLDDTARRRAELDVTAAGLRAELDRLDALPDRAQRCDSRCTAAETGWPAAADPARRTAADPAPPAAAGPARRTAADPAPRTVAGPARRQRGPVACSLAGPEQAGRAGQWRRLLSGHDRHDIADGVSFRLPADQAAAVVDLAVAEQRCCPFLDFSLHLDGDELLLEIRAPGPGGPAFADLLVVG